MLRDAERQQRAWRDDRIRRFRLGHDLHATELTSARDLWRSEDRLRATTLALHLERINRELRHLLWPQSQVLFERLLLDPLLTLRNRFLVPAIRARQKPIARLKKQVGPTRRARVMLYLSRFHVRQDYRIYRIDKTLFCKSCKILQSCSHSTYYRSANHE